MISSELIEANSAYLQFCFNPTLNGDWDVNELIYNTKPEKGDVVVVIGQALNKDIAIIHSFLTNKSVPIKLIENVVTETNG